MCLHVVSRDMNCNILCPCHCMPKLIHHDLVMRPKVGSDQGGGPSVHGPGHLVSVQPRWVRQDGQQPQGGVRRGFQEGWDLTCRDEAGAGGAPACPIRARRKTGVG